MVSLNPDFSQFLIGTFCLTGIVVLISLVLGIAAARMIWAFALRGEFGDE